MTPLEIKKWLDRIDRDQLSTGEYAAVTEAAEIMELVQEVIRLSDETAELYIAPASRRPEYEASRARLLVAVRKLAEWTP